MFGLVVLIPRVPLAQQAAGRAVIGDFHGVYLIDFASGTATVLSIIVPPNVPMFVSPDQTMVAVSNSDGLTLYVIEGTQARKLGNISQSMSLRAAWAADSSSLSFIQEVGGRRQVCIWSRATRAVKVLL